MYLGTQRSDRVKIFKFKKRVEIDKSIGNLILETIHYGAYENGKHKNWSELCLWYDNDCEHCSCGWEDRSYEGECNACGCYLAKRGHEEAPVFVCMLPDSIKRVLVKLKGIDND